MYFAVGSKRNIDLDADKIFELFNGNVHDPNLFASNTQIGLVLVQGKDENLTLVNKFINIA